MGPRPIDPIPEAFQSGKKKDGEKAADPDRMVLERKRIKELVPPVVYMVHGKIGNSSSFIVPDMSGGKFGPFEKQLFIADQSHSNISRVFIEEVNGIMQGVVFQFRKGFKSGLIGGRMNEKGQIFAGGSDRGWRARVRKNALAFQTVPLTFRAPKNLPMAKTCWLEREKRKSKCVAKYAAQRAELKKKGDYIGLSMLPRNASPVRLSRRCNATGRKRAFMGRFKISRIAFREMASNGLIPGVTKSSW